jgi:hypothetical protein
MFEPNLTMKSSVRKFGHGPEASAGQPLPNTLYRNRLLMVIVPFQNFRSSRGMKLRRVLPANAILDAVVIHQLLNGFGNGAPVNPLDKADGVNTLIAKAVLAGTEQTALSPVMT